MAEKNTKKKPQSLNDSHYRFLQEISAPPKPSSKPLHDGSEHLPKQTLFEDDDDDAPSFSMITDFGTPPEEKLLRVKIKGRRRLCKLSSQVDDDTSEIRAVTDDPDFSEIADFESPPPPPPPPPPPARDVDASDKHGGGNEIMDILGELSARLEFLSIDKRKDTKKPDLAEKSVPVLKFEEIPEENVDPPEYASAGSSFSHKSGASDSLLDTTEDASSGTVRNGHENVAGNLVFEHSFVSKVEIEEKFDRKTEQKGEVLVGKVHGGYTKDEVIRVDKKPVSLGKSSMNHFVGRDEEIEDDCVVVSGNKFSKEFGRPGKNVKEWNVSEDVSSLEDESSITLRGAIYTYKLQGDIAKMLYPHQREGLKWLWSLHCQGKGGILGDDMGLGKTMQICGFLAGLFSSRLIKRALIVAPKTLLPHWIKELSTAGLSDKTREYFGTCIKARQYELQYVLQDKGILLTTYDIVRANSKSLRGDTYIYNDESDDEMIWDYMILDEGHMIKNPSTQRAKSLLEIPSAHRIIISGTPIQNNLKELWALFNFCCPELFGDKKSFKERFEQPILRGNEKNASERQKRFGSEVAKELRECIQPYFLRRLKTEVFNEEDANEGKGKLSKKNELIVWLKLTSCQRQIYEAYLKSELVLSAFDGSPLAALTILKKICDHPLLLTKRAAEDVLEEMDTMLQPDEVNVANKLAMYIAEAAETDDFEENQDNISCKISFISSLLDDLIPKGHNVLIFSQTRKMLNLIQDSLASNGYDYVRIDGTTKASDRLKIVDDYQNGDGPPIFLLTSQVGGLGLTLTRADRVIVADPAWNPSTDSQSVDRAYRIGQTKDVVVYRLMTCGTVEEKIYRKQIFKGGLFRTATEHKEQTRYFSQQDLRELFSLPAQGFDVSPTQQQLHEEHDSLHIMDEQLSKHIKFLESQGIAGVSHHSLLFSKAAPVQNVDAEEEEVRTKMGATYVGPSVSSYSVERSVDGSEYAFNPKDVRLSKKNSTPDSTGKLTESEIKERIDRLSKTLANKAMMSRLPDKGAKLEIQVVELSAELQKLRQNGKEVIDLDSFSGDFQRVLNV